MKSATPIVVQLDRWDERVLQALHFYEFVQPENLCYLFFGKLSSLTHVKARLKILVDKGYLQLVQRPDGKLVRPYWYTLSGAGVRYLKEKGMERGRYFRPHKQGVRNESDLAHIGGVNYFLGAIERLTLLDSRVTIVERFHDLELQSHPCYFPAPFTNADGQTGEKRAKSVPDWWLHCSVALSPEKSRRFNFWGELDMGTQGEAVIKRKVRNALLIQKSGSLKTRFHAKAATFTYVTMAGQERVSLLREWMREELLKDKKEAAYFSQMFLVTSLSHPIDPFSLAYEPVWLHPFDDTKRVSLFDLK